MISVDVDSRFTIEKRFVGKDKYAANKKIEEILGDIYYQLKLRPDLVSCIDQYILEPDFKLYRVSENTSIVKFVLGFVISDQAMVRPVEDYIYSIVSNSY
jgi:hypothetical protein